MKGPAAPPAPLSQRLLVLLRNAPRRLRERPFWVIQAGVLGVTAVHILGELWSDQVAPGVHPALHHVPVILYLAPIAYASLRYGIEGAVLTGAWSALLTLPNILIWHAVDWEWLTELVYVAVVVCAGVVMAVPVERERRQRRRAEATSRRLRLLHDVATLTLTAPVDRTLREGLATLVDVLGLEAACLATAPPDRPEELAVLAQHPPRESAAPPAWCRAACRAEAGTAGPEVATVGFDTDLPEPGLAGRVSGVLAVRAEASRALGPDDRELLVGVAHQLAIALANARLHEHERDRVRSYARLVTWAQEEERKRISRELHDETAQSLVAIRRELDEVAATCHAPPAASLERLHELTAATLAGVRRFSRDLRPPVLDDLGLTSALESLVADRQGQHDPAVALSVDGAPQRLPSETELALFRVAQSALHNVERHAEATHATVELAFMPDRTRLAVTDDGRGFDPPDDVTELARSGRLGLLGMHERAQLVGGRLRVRGKPGAGTRVEAEVPTGPEGEDPEAGDPPRGRPASADAGGNGERHAPPSDAPSSTGRGILGDDAPPASDHGAAPGVDGGPPAPARPPRRLRAGRGR